MTPSRTRPDSLAAEAAFRREIAPWALLGLTLGLVEGATAAVLIKKTFGDAASPWAVNLAVAFVSGAPALSNVVSFVWANLAHGRARIGLVVALQAGFALLVGLLGVAPRALGGLAFAVASILAARVVSNLLFGLTPYDPLTLALSAVALTAVAFVAAIVPARRASRVDPVVALRYE